MGISITYRWKPCRCIITDYNIFLPLLYNRLFRLVKSIHVANQCSLFSGSIYIAQVSVVYVFLKSCRKNSLCKSCSLNLKLLIIYISRSVQWRSCKLIHWDMFQPTSHPNHLTGCRVMLMHLSGSQSIIVVSCVR
jgi:hypothetical protein